MSTGQVNAPKNSAALVAAPPAGNLAGRYPLSSVLVVFGIGLSVGVTLGIAIGRPGASRLSFGRRTGIAAETLGRKMMDALADVLPESLSKHIS